MEQIRDFNNEDLNNSQKAVIDMMIVDPESEPELNEKMIKRAHDAIKMTETFLTQLASRNKTWMDLEVGPDQYLKLRNGMIAKSIRDLITILHFIDHETYGFHVTEKKNDFADWIFVTYKNRELGTIIEKRAYR